MTTEINVYKSTNDLIKGNNFYNPYQNTSYTSTYCNNIPQVNNMLPQVNPTCQIPITGNLNQENVKLYPTLYQGMDNPNNFSTGTKDFNPELKDLINPNTMDKLKRKGKYIKWGVLIIMISLVILFVTIIVNSFYLRGKDATVKEPIWYWIALGVGAILFIVGFILLFI